MMEGAMTRCGECGAVIEPQRECMEHFHALLALEREVDAPPDVGQQAHFHAVSSYVLQHPVSMRCSADARAGLRRLLAEQLSARVTLEQVRRQVRRNAEGAARVTRGGEEAAGAFQALAWPTTVVDVLRGGADGYPQRVRAWAASVVETLGSTAG
jgi:hypothetical protein